MRDASWDEGHDAEDALIQRIKESVGMEFLQ